MNKLDPIVTRLGLDGVDKIEPLQQLCKQLRIFPRPAYFVLIVGFISVFMIVLGLADSIITNVIGVLYPTYMSIKAIETSGDDKDDKQWLSYWIVFSLTTTFDTHFGFILTFIPFYYMFKLAFLIYLFHPRSKGAQTVYENIVRPLYVQYGGKLDEQIKKYEQKAEEFTQNLQHKLE